jgi:hypothetical protein
MNKDMQVPILPCTCGTVAKTTLFPYLDSEFRLVQVVCPCGKQGPAVWEHVRTPIHIHWLTCQTAKSAWNRRILEEVE